MISGDFIGLCYALIMNDKAIPFGFVLERLENKSPVTRPMFGCHAIYIGEKIVLILRNKATEKRDNGVWLATTPEHHTSLKLLFPSMRSIQLFGGKISSWQNIPAGAIDFEESVMVLCDLIIKNDSRIGKIPKGKNSKRR